MPDARDEFVDDLKWIGKRLPFMRDDKRRAKVVALLKAAANKTGTALNKIDNVIHKAADKVNSYKIVKDIRATLGKVGHEALMATSTIINLIMHPNYIDHAFD